MGAVWDNYSLHQLNESFVSKGNGFCNQSINDTCINKFYFYQSPQLVMVSILLVAIVAGNATVVLALLLNRSKKSRMNYFIMQLAIADLLVGFLIVLPDIIQRITITWFLGAFACKLYKYLQGVVTYSSTYVLVALSIDRCDAISHPMNFTSSWQRARGLIVVAWLLSFVFCIPMLILFDIQVVQGTTQCWLDLEPSQWRVYVTTISILVYALPALIILASYAVIVVTIRHKSQRAPGRRATMRQYSDDLDGRRASSRGIIPKAKIKTVIMTVVIFSVFVLCWAPYMIFDLLQVYGYIPQTQSNIALASLIQSLAPLNSAANPVFYFIFSRKIFKSLKDIPPYKWFWCWLSDDSPTGTESRAHTELLTSSHRRTRKDLTVKIKEEGPKQRLLECNNSSKVRLHLPDAPHQNNNCHPHRRCDTFL